MKQTNKYKETGSGQGNTVIRRSETRSGKKISEAFIISLCVFLSMIIGASVGLLAGRNNKTDINTGAVAEEQAAQAEEEQSAEQTAAQEQTEEITPEPQMQAASAITPAYEENDLINIIAAARQRGMSKRAYLTFDDGPSSSVTDQVLSTLKTYGIKATFFQVGNQIAENNDVAKRVYADGHLIASHSYTHNYNTLYANEDSFIDEIQKTEALITDVTGQAVTFKLFRFPGGSYNAGDHAAEKQVYKNTLAEMGYYYCDWNTLNGDAEGAQKDAAGLFAFFKESAQSFLDQDKNVIVLMHDSDAKQATADALENIINYLMDYGYTFHRLDDII